MALSSSPSSATVPPPIPDFSSLASKFEKLAETGDSADEDSLLKALKAGEPLDDLKASLDEEAKLLRHAVLAEFSAKSKNLVDLNKRAQEADLALSRIEKELDAFQCHLRGVSDEIRSLQHSSSVMNDKLNHRLSVQKELQEYVNKVVVSPTLVKGICEVPADQEEYSAALEELSSKIAAFRADGGRLKSQSVAAAQVSPELEKLRLCASQKCRDFLITKIGSLRKPKTNIQILQRNVLVHLKGQVAFLEQHCIEGFTQVRDYYVTTMSRVYLNQFRMYLQSLARWQLAAPTGKNLITGGSEQGGNDVTLERRLQSGISDAIGGFFGARKQTGTATGNVFSLAGRGKVISELDEDPIVAHAAIAQAQRENVPPPMYYAEEIFRSHQRLLCDTCTSEYLFICDFFNCHDSPVEAGRIYEAVLGRTLSWFMDSMQKFVNSSWDSIGMLLMLRVVDHCQGQMNRRRLTCMDSYLSNMHALLWARLTEVLRTNILSLRAIASSTAEHTEPPLASAKPHVISRRYAEMTVSLYTCLKDWPQIQEAMTDILWQLHTAFRSALVALSRQLPPQKGHVFIINNADLILTILHGGGDVGSSSSGAVPVEVYKPIEDLLRKDVAAFVDSELSMHFGGLVKFVTAVEEGKNESSGDLKEMERLARHFTANWKSNAQLMQKTVMESFTNFNNGMDVLKQAMTQLLLHYTKFQKIIAKSYGSQEQPDWVRTMVPNATILAEIKKYSKLF